MGTLQRRCPRGERRESGWRLGIAGCDLLIGWLFTIGYVHLTVKQALLGVVIWAYYLGRKLGHVP